MAQAAVASPFQKTPNVTHEIPGVPQARLQLDAKSLQQEYSKLCATPTSSPTSAPLSSQEVVDLYSKGLAAAANIQQQSVKANTVKVRQSAMRELADWLHSTHAASSRSVMTVIPEDLLVYLTQQWLPNHAGASTATGTRVAAPGSLASIKSHLAQEFDLLGRTGEWNASTQSGNPVHSVQVTRMVKGYSNHATDLGYQKRGAEPLSEAQMHTLLESMHRSSHSNMEQHQLLLVLRDGLLFSLLWQTCFRGNNAGALRLDNIQLPTGESALPYLIPDRKLQAGSVLHLLPDSTKNKKGGHCKVVLSCDVMCFTTWLQLAVCQYAEAGQPITNFITRPLSVGTSRFTEQPMTCSNAWARLTKHLKALDMYTGQSVHSTRRGNMIHRQQQKHESYCDIGEAAMCTEKNAKYYTDTHRPTRLRTSAV